MAIFDGTHQAESLSLQNPEGGLCFSQGFDGQNGELGPRSGCSENALSFPDLLLSLLIVQIVEDPLPLVPTYGDGHPIAF